MLQLLARRWRSPRRTLEATVRRFLAPLTRRELSSLLTDRRLALASAAALLATGTTVADPPIELSDIAAGIGGFVIEGYGGSDLSGASVSGAGDVNGDGRVDLLVGAPGADRNISSAGETYVVFGPAPPCIADFDGTGDVGFADLVSLLASWGPCARCPQDLDGDEVVGFADLLIVLGSWGACR